LSIIKINLTEICASLNVKLCEKETREKLEGKGRRVGRDKGKEGERGREGDLICIFKLSLK